MFFLTECAHSWLGTHTHTHSNAQIISRLHRWFWISRDRSQDFALAQDQVAVSLLAAGRLQHPSIKFTNFK